MRKPSRLVLVLSFTTLICILTWVAPVSAVTEVVNPVTFQTTGGASVPADDQPSLFSEDDDQYVEYTSESSGDGNYFEVFNISKKDTQDFKSYFRLQSTYSTRFPVEFVDEKSDNDDVVHKNVTRIKDGYSYPSSELIYTRNQWVYLKERINESSVEENGTFEFHFLSESTDGSFTVIFGDYDYRTVPSFDAETIQGFGINFGIAPGLGGNPNSSFFCATRWTSNLIEINSTPYEPNKWFHVQMVFNFNESWAIKINNNAVYNSTNWTIPSEVTKFDDVTMHTQTNISASKSANDVFYIDALGLSYDLTDHNVNSDMDFILNYQPYENAGSRNNWNDHVVAASIEVFFRFSLGELSQNAGNLIIKAFFTNPVDSSALKLYHWKKKVYDIQDGSYNPYVITLIEDIPLSKDQEDGINSSIYINDDGRLTLKLDTQATNYFEFHVDYMAVEYNIVLLSEIMLILLPIIGIAFVIIVWRIMRKTGYRSSRRRRGGASRR